MRRIHKVVAVGASSLLLTLALTPAALAAGSLSASHGKSAAATSGVKYRGKTSQASTCAAHNATCGKIGFTYSRGKVSGTITWYAACTGNKVLVSGTNFKAKVSGGKFAISGNYTAQLNAGYVGKYHVSIAGSGVGSKKATGTFSGRAGVYKGASKVATCKSGKVTWRAKRQ